MYNYKEEKHVTTRRCEEAGCAAPGEYRAPKSRAEKPDYFWFCLDHVREYNKQWDYFDGMSTEEIEAFRKGALHGHRPTWNHQIFSSEERLRQAAEDFFGEQFFHQQKAKPTLATKFVRALDVLKLGRDATLAEIKAQYKKLVKRYHPDLNQGDPNSEEQFKEVTAAYHLLVEHHREAPRA